MKSIILTIFMALPLLSFSQSINCGTARVNNELLEQQPERQAIVNQLNRDAQEFTNAHYGERGGNIKVIPIVFHIIHNYGSENIPKEDVEYAVETANVEFSGQNVNINSIATQFQSIFADSEIEFRLAKLDPNGNCTDGVTRTVSNLTYGAGENVKDLISWNTTEYLNVWVVYDLEIDAGGYAYYPGNAPSQSHEGIILRFTQLAGSLSHEIGHYLNLRHTWGGSNDTALPDNCDIDDNVSDTPNTIGSDNTCNTGQITCGSLDNVQNHMDYSSCGRMFTNGQKSRMHSTLNSSTAGRNNLWQPNNLIATGTNDGFVSSCVPNVEFGLDNALGCEGFEVDFEDLSWGADLDATWTWSWSFPGGTPATSSDQNPSVTYNAAGNYNASLTITNSAGSETETVQDVVTVVAVGDGFVAPFLEGVEATSFPSNTNPQLEWRIESEGGLTWQRTSQVSYTDDACARINLRSISEGKINSLISPPLDFSNVEQSDANMTFRLAHAPRLVENSAERLRIYVSKNCGETWTLRYSRSGDNLHTNGGDLVASTFIPESNEWREETVSLTPLAGQQHVLIKFEALSDKEHYLYIDDINIAPNATISGVSLNNYVNGISLYPNPITEDGSIEFSLKESTQVEIELINPIGQSMGMKKQTLKSGLNKIAISSIADISVSGVYIVLVKTDLGTQTLKFIKQ